MNRSEKHQPLSILFADIGGSTSLYEQVGDTQAHHLIKQSLKIMENAITDNGGQLLRTVGDAALASFTHCDQAYKAAVSIQESHIHCELNVRIGFHYGPVIPDEGDIYGNAVNIAARVSSLANLGEITTTEAAVEEMSAELQQFSSLLDFINVKGISEPLPVYRLFWQGQESGSTAIQTAISLSMRNPCDIQLTLTCKNQTIHLNAEHTSITIGRSENNCLSVNNDCASRTHASIQYFQGKFILQDQSTNGTYLIKGDQAAVFLRRESVTLDASGIIGPGWLPTENDSDAIHFHCHAIQQNLP